MNRFVLSLGLFALVLAVQPVFMASAGTKLYVEQEGSDDAKDEDGGYRIYNSVPTTSDDYNVPLRNKLVSTPSAPKTVRGIPSTWRVLDDNIIQNRLTDTKAALALASKLRAKLSQPEPWPSTLKSSKKNEGAHSAIVTNERDAEENKEQVERDMEKQKKKADKAAKKKAEEDQKKKEEADQEKETVASGTTEEEPTEKKNSLKRKKKSDEGPNSSRVFNLPD